MNLFCVHLASVSECFLIHGDVKRNIQSVLSAPVIVYTCHGVYIFTQMLYIASGFPVEDQRIWQPSELTL